MKKIFLFLNSIICISLLAIMPTVTHAQMSPSYSSSQVPMMVSQGENMVPASTMTITIQNMQFMPSDITIAPGTTVVWTNNDSVTHTSTSDANSAESWDSGGIQTGASFSKTFMNEGTFTYHCNIHPNMHGTIRVMSSSSAPPSPSMSPMEQPTMSMPSGTSPEYTSQQMQSMQSNDQAQVTIQNMQFMPQETDVLVGTTITWMNADAIAHTSTADDSSSDQSWDSGMISPGQTFSKTFTTPGTFSYHCNIHPTMHGVIRVFQNASDMSAFQSSSSSVPFSSMDGMRIISISIPEFCRHFFPQFPQKMTFSY